MASLLKVPLTDVDDSAIERVAHALFHCVKMNALKMAKLLTHSISRENRKRAISKVYDGKTPLFLACQEGLVDFIHFFVNECDADIEQQSIYEMVTDDLQHRRVQVTPLWCSAASNKTAAMEALLKHGADVDATSDAQNTGSTAVQIACYTSNLEAVKLLSGYGADLNKSDNNGSTCLMNAVYDAEICLFLLDENVDVNAEDVSGNSALHYAIHENRQDTVRMLLQYGVGTSAAA